VIALVLVLSAAVGLGIGFGIREYLERRDGDEAAGADPAGEPPPEATTTTSTTTTTTTTIPTVAVSVRWVIADDVDRPVGGPCQADPPHDPAATLEVQDDTGQTLAGPVPAGEGTAEPGTGFVDDIFNFTSCVYTVAFEAVPEREVYLLVPSSGDEALTVTAADLETAGGQVEYVINTGI
jgi:hypothetical protein